MEKDKIDVAFLLRGMPGMGHVSPGYALGQELEKRGLKCAYISYANGLDFLRGLDLENVHEIKKPEKTKARVPWEDMFELCDDAIPLLQRLSPKVIVVDGEVDSLFLLKNLGCKLVYICTPPYVETDFGVYKRYAQISRAMLKHPDLTIVHGILMQRPIKNVHFVGPLVRSISNKAVAGNPVRKKVTICMTPSSDESLIRMSEKLTRELAKEGYDAELIGQERPGWKFVKEPMLSFAESDAVVVNGGWAVIEEVAMIGKPIVVLSDGDPEKTRNGAIIEQMKLGGLFSISDSDCTSKIIDYVKNTDGNKVDTHIQNGTETAADLVMNILHK